MKKIRTLLISILAGMSFTGSAMAATVSCSFDTGESYDLSTGAWTGSIGFDSLYDLFGDGVEMELKMSLLAKLDTQEIFAAGETKKGMVYLMGSEYGVLSRLSSIEEGQINIYGGSCTVGFG